MKRGLWGFTVIELMVTLVIAAILLAIAAPSFTEFRRSNRLTSTANGFLGAVQTARTEAIKRQLAVSVCPSGNPTASTPTCTTGSFTGWIAFIDADSNCTRTDATLPDGTQETDAVNLVRSGGPIDSKVIVQSSGNCISFAATGFLQAIAGGTTAGTTFLWDADVESPKCGAQSGADTESRARLIEVTNTGRSRITRNLEDVNAALSATGITCP